VRRHPYSVVLFDEIEKAHPEVFNVLLQVMDDGRLTDGKGRTVDMSNTILIMTSNLGSDFIQEYGEERRDEMVAKVQAVLTKAFRPEFINRIDDIVIFHRLSRNEVQRIVPIQLEQVRKRLADRGFALRVSDAAVAWLADRGYDPVYGARPLKRVIQTEVVDELAMAILDPSHADATTAVVDATRDGLRVSLE
jgi:ATP-dependent Clp protease ATP-binding subunit ClpB